MGLVDVINEISKKEYDRLCQMNYKDVDTYGKELQEKSGFDPAGYGYYGSGFFEDNGKYYLRYTRGTSCD